MRYAVIKTIYDAALKNKNIYFLTGDLGHVYEKEFKSIIPQQYLNMGLSEQNMIGVAAGLALSGMKVFAYSIVPFITMRCYEQIKDDLCYQDLDVTLIGIGGGLIYGPYGNTHCSIEDIAVMRVLPNMKIVCPANPQDAQSLTQQLLKKRGPTYIRIGRGKESMPQKEFTVKFNKGFIVKKGKDITIFSTGTILTEAEKAAQVLEEYHISTELIHMHTVKPIDQKLILNRIKNRKAIFTLEDHNIIGGLGSAIGEIVSEKHKGKLIFKRFGVKDIYLHEIGTENYLRNAHGISSSKVVKTILRLLSKK